MITVMFSGGCDSTLVLYTALMKKQRKESSDYDRVNVVSIGCNQIPAQSQQANSREKILNEFRRRELTDFEMTEVTLNTTGSGIRQSETGGIIQPAIWLTLAPLYMNNNGILQMGYHSGDDFWRARYDAEESFNRSCKVLAKTCSIQYPLEDLTKADIISRLKDRGLYELCWYCEFPDNNKPCGNCVPCKTHRTALWQNETFTNKLPFGEEVEIKQPTLSIEGS